MIKRLEHIVLTVSDVEKASDFYQNVFNMTPFSEAEGSGVKFGDACIIFQTLGEDMRHHALEGSAHFCLQSELSAEQLIQHIEGTNAALIEGPIECSGRVMFVLNDPDNNLIKVLSS